MYIYICTYTLWIVVLQYSGPYIATLENPESRWKEFLKCGNLNTQHPPRPDCCMGLVDQLACKRNYNPCMHAILEDSKTKGTCDCQVSINPTLTRNNLPF